MLILVEATGVEPVSALRITQGSTCLALDYTCTIQQRHRYFVHDSLMILLSATKVLNLTEESHLF